MQVLNVIQYRFLSKKKCRQRYEPRFTIRNNLQQIQVSHKLQIIIIEASHNLQIIKILYPRIITLNARFWQELG